MKSDTQSFSCLAFMNLKNFGSIKYTYLVDMNSNIKIGIYCWGHHIVSVI